MIEITLVVCTLFILIVMMRSCDNITDTLDEILEELKRDTNDYDN